MARTASWKCQDFQFHCEEDNQPLWIKKKSCFFVCKPTGCHSCFLTPTATICIPYIINYIIQVMFFFSLWLLTITTKEQGKKPKKIHFIWGKKHSNSWSILYGYLGPVLPFLGVVLCLLVCLIQICLRFAKQTKDWSSTTKSNLPRSNMALSVKYYLYQYWQLDGIKDVLTHIGTWKKALLTLGTVKAIGSMRLEVSL